MFRARKTFRAAQAAAIAIFFSAAISVVVLCAEVSFVSAAAPAEKLVAATSAKQSGVAGELFFETSVRPIFKAHCFQCHGEEDDVQGGLDIRLVRLLKKGGESGIALIAGDHKKSLLYERLAAGEMPPGEKKLSAQELATVARWIDAGARTAKPEPQQVSEITDEDRNFWSFRPIHRPAVPAIASTAKSKVRTPIDAFLLTELARNGLSFSAEADRRTLIRRLYFDLIGLPPTPAEVAAFVADESPTAYEALVDRLLASPHYGERWGRHWLDVAGYADSDGYTPLDPVRKYAYKYRDYVIRAFNADKPWNEFIVEQLAGDELIAPPYAERTPAELEKLVATGFLRMGPDGTADTSVDQALARNDVVAETIKIASTSLLGLSVGCAQCHNHRYDPISQADYYRLRAIFEPAYDVKNWRAPQSRLVPLMTAAERDLAAKIDAEIAAINSERAAELKKIVAEYFEIEVAKVPEGVRSALRAAHAVPAGKRTPEQKKLFAEYPAADVHPGSVLLFDVKRLRAFDKIYDDRIVVKKGERPTEEFVHALTEQPGNIPATFLFFRGDHNAPRQSLKPRELSVLSEENSGAIPEKNPAIASTGRRLAYARHLVDGRHPLTARVLVNRFWMHHFGRGIVASPADFGFAGERPTHPDLLDWLASEFMAGGWRLKSLHRTMLLSAAYRQSSAHSPALDAVDPDNRLLGRMNVRRLEAEILRDCVLSVSGSLNRKAFGPAVPVTPDEIGQVILGIDNRDGAGRFKGKQNSIGDEAYRRSIYIQVRRTLPLGMLETFDAPTMTPNCEVRAVSTVAPQSLLFMNNEFIVTQSEVFARRLQTAAPDDLAAQVKFGWLAAFGVAPTNAQLQEAVAFVKAQLSQFSIAAAAAPKAGAKPAPVVEPVRVPSPSERALASYCQALLSANGFLYVD
ncbi:MAG: DUF1549 domain-containing protein [Planctomycetia bacterium]|nr:DUF1549 domain-containing protein [Planctomycetia bacterium]